MVAFARVCVTYMGYHVLYNYSKVPIMEKKVARSQETHGHMQVRPIYLHAVMDHDPTVAASHTDRACQ